MTDDIKETASTDHDVAYWLASAYALAGEREEAFTWLRRAIKLGNENKPWFESDKNWESLRDDPEFQRIVASIVTPVSEGEG